MVSLPVVLLIALFGLIGWYLRGGGALFIGIFIGAILAWPLWAFLVPRWRDWVEDSGLKGSDVRRLAARSAAKGVNDRYRMNRRSFGWR
jgi:hypothetical protein